MFGNLKEKLKSWIKGSSEKIEEAEAKSTVKDVESTDIDKSLKKNEGKEELDKEVEKAEKIIEEAKTEKGEKVPTEYDPINRKTQPDLNKIKEEAEGIRNEVVNATKKEREVKEFESELLKVDKLIEDSKNEKVEDVPVKFNVGLEKYEPDLEQIGGQSQIVVGSREELGSKVDQESKKGFFQKVKSSFVHKISEEEFDEIFEDLEMLLLENNVALEVVDDFKDGLAGKLIGNEVKRNEVEIVIKNELKNILNEMLIEPDNPLDIIKISGKPFKILFFGVNGTGKTTSIAKVASYLKEAGFSVVLAAGDTFRAASIEQLSEHGGKLGVKVIKQDYGSDPAAVGFDAIKYAEKHKIDVVLIDTAGRMHTKENLMSEMEKIVRVTKPDLKIFVAESIAGNDAVEQAKTFNESVEIDGSILSKADIDDKGGTVISVSHATRKPIFYLGIGQEYGDLELFNKHKFIESLGL